MREETPLASKAPAAVRLAKIAVISLGLHRSKSEIGYRAIGRLAAVLPACWLPAITQDRLVKIRA